MNTSSNLITSQKRSTLSKLAIFLAAIAFALSACQEYNAPPDVVFDLPEGGAFLQGQSIRVQFTEPIDPTTLALSVWPTERGTTRVPASQDVQPLIQACTPSAQTCGDMKLTLDPDGLWAEIELTGEISSPGVPLVLEIHDGLADTQGNQTGVSRLFDFQFRSATCGEAEDLQFDDGIYILGATVNQPMTAVLTLVSHITALPNGKFAMAGAKAQPLGDAPKSERDPAKLRVATDDSGFALFTKGCVSQQFDGRRLLETEPVDIELPVLNFIIRLTNVRIFADIKKHPESGKDHIEGTLSYERLQLVNGPVVNEYDGASTAVTIKHVPESPTDLRPEGYPQMCTNPCGAITGFCHPPEDFPGEGFCP